MKKLLTLFLVAGSTLLSAPVFSYEPPTDDELSQLLANPSLIKTMLADASGEQAAELMARIISNIQQSNLGPKQLEYLVAFYTSSVVFLLPPSERGSFAETLLANAPAELMPTLFSGLAIGGSGSSAFMTQLREQAGDDPLLQRAIDTPSLQLTGRVYTVLISALASQQTLPPAPTDSLPPSGGFEAGGGTTPEVPPTPPVPPTYDGQG